MADKETKLSIVIRTVDKATAKLKAINDRLDAVTKPIRDFKEQLADLREKSGLDDVIGGFQGVGSAIAGVLAKVAVVGGVIAGAVVGLFSLVDGFDELGDKAEAIGVSVDFLAQMRYAAERSGASVESLDAGLQSFTKSLGMARANSGPLVKFLGTVSPVLLKQLKATKDSEAAFNLLAGAMAKIEDPAKRAAFAQKVFGDASLGPLFHKGPKGIKELRDRYLELAGPQGAAAEEAGKVDDAMKDLKAATDGVKAALVTGLSPALTEIIAKIKTWLVGHRDDIAKWAKELGEKLPGAFSAVVDAIRSAISFITPFIDEGWKLKAIALVLAGVIVGPLVAAIYTLGVALLTTPVGWIVAGIAAIAAGAYLLIDNWNAVAGFFTEVWDTVTGKFGWARTLIKTLLAPIIGIPGVIIAAWGDITDFFGELWDGITGVFSKAYEIIQGIVDKIVAAVDFVANKVKTFINGTEAGRAQMLDILDGGGLSPEQREKFIKGSSSTTEARVTVDFENAPRGTRVSADPQSTASVDLSVGYQMLVGGMW